MAFTSLASERNKQHPWRVLSIMLVGTFMALLDVTIVNVALPDIREGINASNSVLEWIVSGYALAFGLALIPAGRLGDNYGHKLTFIIGLTIFTLASLGCGFSETHWQIITSRIVQGFGAGIFVPAIAASIRILFEGRERSRAFSVLGAVVGASTALGPLLGGVLVQYAGWEWVFIVNVPIGLVLVPLALWQLPASNPDIQEHKFDPFGILLLTVGLTLLLLPLVEGQTLGWPVWIWLCLAASIGVFIGLWRWELQAEKRPDSEPVLPPTLFKELSFSAGSLLALVYFAAFTSIFFSLSILWQEGLGRSALDTGLTIIPFALCSMITASLSHKVSARLGRRILLLGCSLVTIGLTSFLIVLYAAGESVTHWQVLVPLAIAGAGNGLFIAPNQDFAIANINPKQAGAASGVLITAQRVGSALGIAAIGTVLFGTLDFSGQSPAEAFTKSTILATILNVVFVITALLLVFVLPKKIPARQ